MLIPGHLDLKSVQLLHRVIKWSYSSPEVSRKFTRFEFLTYG